MASELEPLRTRGERSFVSRSAAATEALAAALARHLPRGSVVALDGELGAGKTCFVRGLASGLACESAVASPTYTLMHEYPGPVPLFHFDAWMQGREEAFLEGGGAEWLATDGVAAIEWAGRVERFLPPARMEVRLEHARDLALEARRISIRVLAPDGGAEPAQGLERALRELALPAGIEEARRERG